jgi:glycosyltransferase involved in cell wall biosynthesis
MNKVTIFYTNWKRNKYLQEIIENTKKQTLQPKIVVVDNSSSDEENKFVIEDTTIDIVNRSNALKCWERWLISNEYESTYKCIMDDDLSFSREGVLEDCFNYMEVNKDIDCIGVEGVTLMKGKTYYQGNHQVAKMNYFLAVHVVKGRFMFIRSSSLKNLDLNPDLTCDDIKVSSFLNKKVLPSFLASSFYDFPQGEESLSNKTFQQVQRDYAHKKYFR